MNMNSRGHFQQEFSISNHHTNPILKYIEIPDDGRLVLSVSSATIDTIWSMGIIIHNQSQASMLDMSEKTLKF